MKKTVKMKKVNLQDVDERADILGVDQAVAQVVVPSPGPVGNTWSYQTVVLNCVKYKFVT